MDNFIGIFDSTKKISDRLKKPIEGTTDFNSIMLSKNALSAKLEANHLFVLGNVYNIEAENIALEILTQYLKTGNEALMQLDGEFVIIIQTANKTIIYRDRHGAGSQVFYNEKYYSAFLKSYLNIQKFEVQPNTDALFTFLSIGYIPSPLSSLKGIKKLPAGQVLTAQNNKLSVEELHTWEAYKNATITDNSLSENDATAKYEELHQKAIKLRVKNKSKVGLLLSGGYDSGGNIAGLREVYGGDAYSYSIGFKDNPWTELPLAKILSEHFGTNHTEYEIDGTEINELPFIVDFLGDPFQEGGLMVNYTAMKLVGDDKPELILGGDGNDQHFGTAGKELALNYQFRKKGYAPFQKMLSSFDGLSLFNKDNIFFRSQFHNEKILNIQKSDNFGFKQHQLKKLVNQSYSLPKHNYLDAVPTTFSDFDDFYKVHNYFGDIKQVINEVILFKASKMATMFGNNLSFPYMNTEIYNFLKTVPRDLKCKGSVDEMSKGKGVTKYLHKKYLEPKLPTEITNRKKQGGFAPLPIFFKNDVQRGKLKNFILSSDISKELFNKKQLIKFFDNYDSLVKSKEYWFWFKQVQSFKYFNLLVLAVWWEIFMNQRSAEEINSFLTK